MAKKIRHSAIGKAKVKMEIKEFVKEAYIPNKNIQLAH